MDKTMDDKSIYNQYGGIYSQKINKMIHKIDYKQWLKRLNTHFNEPMNQNQIKVPKIIKRTNKKINIKLWGLV